MQAEYAVRGKIVIRADEHATALAKGEERPFKKIIYCNIGNPQQLGQKPLTFQRQVAALVNHPALLEADPAALGALFAPDAVQRAKDYLASIPGGVGAYSNSQGVQVVREEVAAFLQKRDGHAAHPEHIFLTDGASPAVQMCLSSIIRNSDDAVMIPLPQYPLYSAALALYGGSPCGYYLTEETNWGLTLDSLTKAYEEGVAAGKNVRALVVINPGNPTGGVLSVEDMQGIVQFCVDKGLALMADEVYQENIWAEGATFTSFKKVAADMGLVDPSDVSGSKSKLQLASFHSVSKGFLGECGRRGGYVEVVGFDQGVREQLYKMASISLCSNLTGQITTGLMVNPPKEGAPSHAQYEEEKGAILASLKRRAQTLAEGLNAMEGVTCQPPQGALYAFPSIVLPPKAVAAAEKEGVAADAMYCMRLLDATGVVVVPGSGFGQVEGTFHFRTTILPPEEEIATVVESMQAFHKDFLAEFAE